MIRYLPILRLQQRQIAKLHEIRGYWDICDVVRANEMIDMQDDAEWLHQKEIEAKAKR